MSKPVTPPEANPSHPQHHGWLMRTVNTALDLGVFVITGGRVQLGAGSVVVNPDIEKGTVTEPKAPAPK